MPVQEMTAIALREILSFLLGFGLQSLSGVQTTWSRPREKTPSEGKCSHCSPLILWPCVSVRARTPGIAYDYSAPWPCYAAPSKAEAAVTKLCDIGSAASYRAHFQHQVALGLNIRGAASKTIVRPGQCEITRSKR